jgi:hypothetical protein
MLVLAVLNVGPAYYVVRCKGAWFTFQLAAVVANVGDTC